MGMKSRGENNQWGRVSVGVWGENKIRLQSTAYLSQLVVDHHIVRFDITMHDSHTVTVVQSLTHTHTHQHKKVLKCFYFW